MFYVYKITCEASQKSYIGVTYNAENRFSQHMRGRGNAIALTQAVKKYGQGNFSFIVIGCYNDVDSAGEAERNAIISHNTISPNGYNLSIGGPGTKYAGRFDDETKNRMSEARRGLKNHLGHKHTEEAKKKLSDFFTGKKLPDWIKQKLKGRKISEEERLKRIGRKVSDETKEKISESMYLHERTDEHCENIRRSKIGHVVSEETRMKISKTLKSKNGRKESK